MSGTLNYSPGVSAFTRLSYCMAVLLAMFEAVLPGLMSVRPVEMLLVMLIIWIFIGEKGLYLPKHEMALVIGLFMLYVVFFGLIGQMYFSLPFSGFIEGFAPAARIVIYSIFFWAGYHIFSREPHFFHTVLRVMAVSLVIHGLYGLIQFSAISFSIPSVDSLPYIPVYQFIDGRIREVDYAATGFTDAVYTLAAYGIYALIIGLSLINSRLWPHRHTILLVVLGYSMVLTSYRRSQLIAITIVALVLIIVKKSYPGKKLFYILVTAAMLSLPVIFLDSIYSVNTALADRIYSIKILISSGETGNAYLSSLSGRIEGTWAAYLDLARQYPAGTGLYPPNILKQGSDNAYLTHLVWGGIPLALLYVLLLAAPIYRALSKVRKAGHLSGIQTASCYLTAGVSMSMLITGISGGEVFSLPSQAPYWIALSHFVSIGRD